MSAAQIVLLGLGLLLALGIATLTYQRFEPRGRGRPVLIGLRAAALVLIVLLLIDPRVGGGPQRGDATRIVLDASLSMSLGDTWPEAVAAAQRSHAPVLIAGSGAATVAADSLQRLTPTLGESRVLPALQSAAEAGAGRVTLITDGAIDDAADVARWLPGLGLTLDVVMVGAAAAANRALAEVEAPAWAAAGQPLQLRVRRVANGMDAQDRVVVRQDGSVIARTSADTVSFMASGPREGGLVRYDVAYETPDSIPDDDVRSIYVYVSDRPAGVALVSFAPDWEPRFLHPVLESALGLPVRTFLRVPAGLYFRGGTGLDAGGRAEEDEVVRAARGADLLVLHGLGRDAPAWAHELARTARRLIVLPAASGIQTPFVLPPAAAGDWYVSPELAPSPISALLVDMDKNGLPPLNALHAADLADGAWTPLVAGRSPRGGQAPVFHAAETPGRRYVIALGSGYWRWAFRGGSSRVVYQRLWGALAGWVVQEQAQVAGASVRPAQRSVTRGRPLRWVAPGLAADSFALTLNGAGGATLRSTLSAETGDTAISAAVAPGHYTYDIRAYRDGAEIARADGPLTVESYSPEFIRRIADVRALERAPDTLQRAGAGQGRPLHTFAWLYVILVTLLCLEWILRRRWGLR